MIFKKYKIKKVKEKQTCKIKYTHNYHLKTLKSHKVLVIIF